MRDTNLITEDHTIATKAAAVNSRKSAGEALLHYFNLSINGTDYCFNTPLDSISYIKNSNGSIYFQNAAATKFGWLSFQNQDPYQAGLIELFDPETGIYLILYGIKDAVYPVSVTESGTAGEFMQGHYSGIYTDAHDNPVYDVCCSFRVLRNK
jgi:hypothetical protein